MKITIVDNGVGILDEIIDTLNEKKHYFYSTDDDLNLRHGIGLILVRHIVDAHNGSVKFDSSVGQGFKTTLIYPSN